VKYVVSPSYERTDDRTRSSTAGSGSC